MANEKRYYWLKFREDFFNSMRVKKLRRMAGGDTYIIIYLKMQLKALKTGGVLEFKGVEQDFADELALDLDESPDDVRIVLSYILTYEMCECSDNIHYFLPYVVENTGSETAGTQRWRDWKKRKETTLLDDNKQYLLESNTSPTSCQQNANVEKEIEKDIDIIPPCIPPLQGEESLTGVTQKKKRNRKPFKAPTLEEVREYISSANLNIDPKAFYDYFTTPDDDGKTWIDSEGKPVRNWKQKIQTWARMGTSPTRVRSRNTLLNYNEHIEDRSGMSVAANDLDLEELG